MRSGSPQAGLPLLMRQEGRVIRIALPTGRSKARHHSGIIAIITIIKLPYSHYILSGNGLLNGPNRNKEAQWTVRVSTCGSYNCSENPAADSLQIAQTVRISSILDCRCAAPQRPRKRL